MIWEIICCEGMGECFQNVSCSYHTVVASEEVVSHEKNSALRMDN